MSANRNDNTTGNTGTRDITYDLISTVYHLLQGAETVGMYIEDGGQESDQEIVQFFRETKDEYTRRADQAKQLLTRHLGRDQGRAASGGGSQQ
jgi:hypothetical protein